MNIHKSNAAQYTIHLGRSSEMYEIYQELMKLTTHPFSLAGFGGGGGGVKKKDASFFCFTDGKRPK